MLSILVGFGKEEKVIQYFERAVKTRNADIKTFQIVYPFLAQTGRVDVVALFIFRFKLNDPDDENGPRDGEVEDRERCGDQHLVLESVSKHRKIQRND
jgi:hypothetical protein